MTSSLCVRLGRAIVVEVVTSRLLRRRALLSLIHSLNRFKLPSHVREGEHQAVPSKGAYASVNPTSRLRHVWRILGTRVAGFIPFRRNVRKVPRRASPRVRFNEDGRTVPFRASHIVRRVRVFRVERGLFGQVSLRRRIHFLVVTSPICLTFPPVVVKFPLRVGFSRPIHGEPFKEVSVVPRVVRFKGRRV